LWRLHWRERAALEAKADEKSRAAEGAVRALTSQLEEAFRRWSEAAAAWGAFGCSSCTLTPRHSTVRNTSSGSHAFAV
jgi:hypothetical protein